MRNRVAKAIRKKVYGDLSRKVIEYQTLSNGMRICVGKRAEYLKAKKDHV